MHELAVGEYYPGTPPYPEMGEYNYSSAGHELRLFYRLPSFSEIGDVRHGQAEFAFVVEGPIIFFLYRFGEDIPWSYAPYSWHLVPEHDRALPEADTPPESRARLSTVLVEGQSGIVRAIRTTTFSPEFTHALEDAIREQAARSGVGRELYDRAVQEAGVQYPTTADLVMMARHRTVGED